MYLKRGSGILLHISSLPSPFGIGDLGPAAFQFVDQLKKAQQKYWQILPLNPTAAIYGNSPYLSVSAFALNPLLVSPELLMHDGLLDRTEIATLPAFPADKVDFTTVTTYKTQLLQKAFFRWERSRDQQFETFLQEQAGWLEDYSLFMALKEAHAGVNWHEWPAELRDREPAALATKAKELADDILFVQFQQYLVQKQWHHLKKYCVEKDIQIIGDLPIYVEYGSADVWCNPDYFKLDEHKQPYVVAGVPPDYFSATGQRWGNPIYNWPKLQQDHFSWWIARLSRNLRLFDIVRIDHFRGLVAYWEIPAEENTAINGEWVPVPTTELMAALQKTLNFNVIAEDLGLITDDVKEAMQRYQLPGMKVLQFAFDDLETNSYLPHHYPENCIVYTGTHDNNTTLAWYQKNASETEKWNLGAYFKKDITAENVIWNLIELALSSRAHVAIIPAQDILQLDGSARMNTPGTRFDNWEWRLKMNQLGANELNQLAELTKKYDRV
ncbi:4-alpha-glucanotransferase [candidate division KSB1 bacterium]|nr:4-alpha-glucanotransferase [candidate division KSB1 bacterium]